MAISDWDAITLCTDADCLKEEQRIIQWNDNRPLNSYRDHAKEKIGIRLKSALQSEQVAMDLDLDENILNHLYPLTALKTATVHLTIHLICRDLMVASQDLYDTKARDHYALYNEEIKRAMDSMHLDYDESGSIEDSEQFNVNTNTLLKRGA